MHPLYRKKNADIALRQPIFAKNCDFYIKIREKMKKFVLKKVYLIFLAYIIIVVKNLRIEQERRRIWKVKA